MALRSSTSTGEAFAISRSGLTLGLDGDYFEYVNAQFMREVYASGFRFMRGSSWATDSDLEVIDSPLFRTRYDYNQADVMVVRIDAGVVFLHKRSALLTLRVAAETDAEVSAIEAKMRARFPERVRLREERVAVNFWSYSPAKYDGHRSSSLLELPTWQDIASNYGPAVLAGLDPLMSTTHLDAGEAGFVPGDGGRLLLWTGPPGTGKTFALRALIRQWRAWCGAHIVIDPETLLSNAGHYLSTVFLDHSDRWKLVVLEDSGELMAADAKNRTGQGLSRLLNLVDGVIGQASKCLVLVTTNEDHSSLNEAMSRPGRCASHIHFTPLAPDQANGWLEHNGTRRHVTGSITLAELFAMKSGATPPPPSSFGFTRAT